MSSETNRVYTPSMGLFFRGMALLVLTVLPASAGDTDLFSQLSSEYAECFAYFTLEKQCAPDEAADEEIARMQTEIDKSGDMTLSSGRAAGFTDDKVGTQYIEALETLTTAMGNECERFSELRLRHGDACHKLLDHPEQRTKEIIDSRVNKADK